jgi:hypothetical protein
VRAAPARNDFLDLAGFCATDASNEKIVFLSEFLNISGTLGASSRKPNLTSTKNLFIRKKAVLSESLVTRPLPLGEQFGVEDVADTCPQVTPNPYQFADANSPPRQSRVERIEGTIPIRPSWLIAA